MWLSLALHCPEPSFQCWDSSGVLSDLPLHLPRPRREVIRGASPFSQNDSLSKAILCPEVPSVHLNMFVSCVAATSGDCFINLDAGRENRKAHANVGPVLARTQGFGLVPDRWLCATFARIRGSSAVLHCCQNKRFFLFSVGTNARQQDHMYGISRGCVFVGEMCRTKNGVL